jgi:hypothetical protein
MNRRGSASFGVAGIGLCVATAFLCYCVPQARCSDDVEGQALQSALLADRELDLHYGERMVCGPAAVYFALASVGRQPRLADIVQHVKVTDRGSTMAAVTDYFGKEGVENYSVRTKRLPPLLSCVRAGERCVILLVDDDQHFLTVCASPAGDLLVLEDTTATPLSEARLDRRFSGIAMIVGNNARWHATARLMSVPVAATSAALVAGLAVGSYGAARVARTRKRVEGSLPERGTS